MEFRTIQVRPKDNWVYRGPYGDPFKARQFAEMSHRVSFCQMEGDSRIVILDTIGDVAAAA